MPVGAFCAFLGFWRLVRYFTLFLGHAEQAAEFFQPYIFYETLPDRSRDCFCTSCRERFNVTRRGNAAFFRASHKGKRNANQSKSKADCPICRTESKLIASNKFSTFRSLCEHRLVARLSAFDG